MQAILNFLIGGGLLALVQAALAFYQQQQAKQLGAAQVNIANANAVEAANETATAIDDKVGTMPIADVHRELRQFERD